MNSAGEEEFDGDTPPPMASPALGFEDFVRDHPLGAVMGALFVGIILGRMGIL